MKRQSLLLTISREIPSEEDLNVKKEIAKRLGEIYSLTRKLPTVKSEFSVLASLEHISKAVDCAEEFNSEMDNQDILEFGCSSAEDGVI